MKKLKGILISDSLKKENTLSQMIDVVLNMSILPGNYFFGMKLHSWIFLKSKILFDETGLLLTTPQLHEQ